MICLKVHKNAYYDSVSLMIISKEVKKLSGVREALVGMGTELNREIARNIGLAGEGFDAVTANDFFVAADCEGEDPFAAVTSKVEELLGKRAERRKADHYPHTLEGALKLEPGLNMAVISLPGRYAHQVARSCLERDINVMLFSDNVTIEEERDLKEYAASKELLVMGPDCGTAIVSGTPLAFANVVKSGDIGMVCASGTGAQEVSSLIDQLGGGISQLLGTGGRDLRMEIGGRMMELGMSALIRDPKTKVLVLVSKPPAPEIARRILDRAAAGGKPTVVCFIGGNPAEIEARGLWAALSLEDAAHKAVALSQGRKPEDFTGFAMGGRRAEELAASETARMALGQKFVRGLYTGGTLCDEAMKLMISSLGHIWSNIPLYPEDRLDNARSAPGREHTFLDFGDDEFTLGRPHPMIDPSLRCERVVAEAADPAAAVLLVDCVIGYGSHEDPAEELSQAIRAAKGLCAKEGRYLAVVASVCGTEGDPQSLAASRLKLANAGAVVLPSNAQAVRFTQRILAHL